ncbi:MAG: hypothetical protein M3N97_14845 [Pseudomonadota bacterium]|nr:hypothetical protein [Pseudomonadota bacterium]
MTRLHTSFVLGFHGCDRHVGEKALTGNTDLIQSDRDYDWLGPGVYFWEGDPARALEWAETKATKIPGMVPFVIGAVIDRGNCLDLTFRENVKLLRDAHVGLVASLQKQGKPPPQNRNPRGVSGSDMLLRDLDCAVIRYLHDSIDQELASHPSSSLEPFDTVRGLFREGDPIYSGSGFYERTHTQIAVRSLGCIKGIFLPRP